MRIIKYKTKLNEDGLAYIVKENSTNYSIDKLDDPEKVVNMLKSCFDLHNETEEYLYLICFNIKMKPVGIFEISHGSVNATIASPREIFQKALLCNAVNIIIAHNHPSGEIEPSKDDMIITERIKEAGKLMEIPLIDNFIISRDKYYSFKENGYV